MKLLFERMHSELGAMCDETEAAVVSELPQVVGLGEASTRRRVIEATFRRVLAVLSGDVSQEADAGTHISFGAAAARAGVPLEMLTAGYRIGARVGWAHVRVAARELELDAETVLSLADGHVAYVDELAANSVEGYAREADAVRGERARERQLLLDALLAGAGEADAARAAARVARWRWPERIAVTVLLGQPRGEPAGEHILIGATGRMSVAAGPPAELDAWLTRTGVGAAVGPAGPPMLAPTSLARAQEVAGLATAGILPADRILRWENELATLVVNANVAAAEALAARWLSPLDDPSPVRVQLLRETLAAWLDHPGRPLVMARTLQLHPQTVRYRLARLRERLGDALDDPEARFELALALRHTGRRAEPAGGPLRA